MMSLSKSLNDNFGLQCYALYAPSIKANDLLHKWKWRNSLWKTRLKLVNSKKQHLRTSLLLDGLWWNPIYGPSGYSHIDGGIVTLMKSSYKLNSSRVGGPPTSVFPLGFFVEDYTYFESSEDDYLDRNNGRFCITPDYPNGTYAYFVTINSDTVESSGVFANYRIPTFPIFWVISIIQNQLNLTFHLHLIKMIMM